MVDRRIAVAGVLMAILISACAGPPRSAAAPDPAQSADQAAALHAGELRQRESSFFAAQADQAAERVAGHYADDATLHVADMPPIQGREAVRAFYSNLLRFLSSTTATPEALRVSRSGDMGYTAGSITNVFDGRDGPAEYPGKYVLVWERRGEEWAIIFHGVSSNQSEANPAPR